MNSKLSCAACLLLMLSSLTSFVAAQSAENDATPPDPPGLPQRSGNSSMPGGYQFPDAHERLHSYVNDAVGPLWLLLVAGRAGILHWRDRPPEWGGDIGGFGQRLASSVGLYTMKRTLEYGVNEALQKDSKYYPCTCSGFLPRLGHAVKTTLTVRNREGRDVFAVSTVAANYAAEVIAATTWYPDRFSYKDGIREGHQALLLRLGVNLAREFVFRRR